MLNIIKTPVVFLTLIFLMFLSRASYAWEDQHGRDDGRSHHEHGFHWHANPDLTLVTGMDTIDSRVLIAADPDPAPVEIEEPVQVVEVAPGAQPGSPDTDGVIIVNVPNKSGGYTPVRIEQWGNGYLGPQGELYYPFPKISQLKAMYGL